MREGKHGQKKIRDQRSEIREQRAESRAESREQKEGGLSHTYTCPVFRH